MALTLKELRDLTLSMDSIHSSLRAWQLFSASDRILQINGSNPRIRELKFEQENLEIFADKVEIFECRIVKDRLLEPLIRVDRAWFISFDDGVSREKFQVTTLKEHLIQGLAWVVILGR